MRMLVDAIVAEGIMFMEGQVATGCVQKPAALSWGATDGAVSF